MSTRHLNDILKYNGGIYACKDGGLIEYRKSLNLEQYYNSGVLYIDKDYWINSYCQERIIYLLSYNNINITFPDQDILNCAIGNEIKDLPISYNILSMAYKLDGLLSRIYFNGKKRNISYEEVRLAKENPKILHGYGLGNRKPWSSHIHPYHDIFMNYMKIINPTYEEEAKENFCCVEKMPEDLYNLLIALRPYAPSIVKRGIKKIIK